MYWKLTWLGTINITIDTMIHKIILFEMILMYSMWVTIQWITAMGSWIWAVMTHSGMIWRNTKTTICTLTNRPWIQHTRIQSRRLKIIIKPIFTLDDKGFKPSYDWQDEDLGRNYSSGYNLWDLIGFEGWTDSSRGSVGLEFGLLWICNHRWYSALNDAYWYNYRRHPQNITISIT